jgi:hypothetical protein
MKLTADLLIDDEGDLLVVDGASIENFLGKGATATMIRTAVHRHGFVHLRSSQRGLFVEINPAEVRPQALMTATDEIYGRAPARLAFSFLSSEDDLGRIELFADIETGLKRLRALMMAAGHSLRMVLYHRPEAQQRRVRKEARWERVASFRTRDGVAFRVAGDDYARQRRRPYEAILAEDEWLGRVLNLWQGARHGSRLPAPDARELEPVSEIIRGRAHWVDACASNPEAFWFRTWAEKNSYIFGASGREKRQLGQMPPGLMQAWAIRNYWEVATTGAPTYDLTFICDYGKEYSYTRLILPLATNGRRVDQLLVLINERDLRGELG